MQCPFLREVSVKFCGLCRLKMIPLNQEDLATERCSGPDYLECPMARSHHDGLHPQERCMFLRIENVHYCAVAPVTKMIPCNKKAFSRCTDEGHRYCQLFLAIADPRAEEAAAARAALGAAEEAEEAPLPESVAFAANHMWLDRGDGGTCHIGVDGFFARALGEIDGVSYPLYRDENRPAVTFRVGGVDFDLVFPNRVHVTEVNTHLVVDPSEVVRDPYGRGWLFEGVAAPDTDRDPARAMDDGLVRGGAAALWMEKENRRLADFVHGRLEERSAETGPVMHDGGRPVGRLAASLGRADLVRLYSEFFTLPGGRTGA